MSNVTSWAEALNISPEILTTWNEEAPQGMPLLVWCLREGKIPLEQYLDWAVEAYGLPHLNSLFFNEAFYPERMTEIAERSGWTPWFFPIAMWDDVITIACVEPASEPPVGAYSYVLADPNVLAEMFQRFQAGEAMDEYASQPPPEPIEEELPEPEPEAPLGVTLQTKKFTLNFDAAPAMPVDEHVEAEAFVAPPPRPMPMQVDEDESPAMEPSLMLMSTENEITALRAPTAKKKAVTETSNAPMDQLMEQAFEELKREYQTALVLKCEDGVAVAFRWPGELAEVDVDRARVDLTNPSLFRIVARTLQPYHGFAVSSQVHEDFFASLNLIVVPSCVTAVAIMVGGEMWGILLALGADSAHGQDALNHVREIADRLGRAFNGEVPAHEAA